MFMMLLPEGLIKALGLSLVESRLVERVLVGVLEIEFSNATVALLNFHITAPKREGFFWFVPSEEENVPDTLFLMSSDSRFDCISESSNVEEDCDNLCATLEDDLTSTRLRKFDGRLSKRDERRRINGLEKSWLAAVIGDFVI
jgi:hypothetical protein